MNMRGKIKARKHALENLCQYYSIAKSIDCTQIVRDIITDLNFPSGPPRINNKILKQNYMCIKTHGSVDQYDTYIVLSISTKLPQIKVARISLNCNKMHLY